MPAFLDAFVAAFLPLFVAINIPGILPLYIGMTEALDRRTRQTLLVRALTAAFVLAVLMLFAGEVIFRTLGITVNDLRVGGGLILLAVAVTDLAFGEFKKRRTEQNGSSAAGSPDGAPQPELSVVPLGIPLIIGPGAITTILVTEGAYGYPPTLVGIVANMLLVFVAFTFGPALLRVAGPSTSKAMAKVASLFLAAISVAMIRAGITGMMAGLSEVLPAIKRTHVTGLDGKGTFERSLDVVRRYLRRTRARRTLVVAINDPSALGALRAFEEAGRSHLCAVMGQNAVKEAIEELRRPGTRLVGSVAYFPERYGEELIPLALSILQKKPVPSAVFVNHQLVTPKNVGLLYPAKTN